MMKIYFGVFILSIGIYSCAQQGATVRTEEKDTPWFETATDDELMDSVQAQTFRYFWDFAEPESGLARERFHPNGDYPMNDSHIVTSGGSGFGVMAILVGIERGFISRDEGMLRLDQIVDFLEQADRYHGVWSHWIDGGTGKTKPFSKKDDGGDLVESSFLMTGLLCVRQYCSTENAAEAELAKRIDRLWHEMEWDWYTQGKDELYWHWSPNYDFDMNFSIHGYNECLITFFLGACSPTHPLDPAVYHEGWAKSGEIIAKDSFLGHARILDHYNGNDSPVGPLFWAHYSYVGLDPRGLGDRYADDYFALNRNHALIHYDHCVANPHGYKGYGPNGWGLTSSYSTRRDGKPGVAYTSHRPDKDKGILSPTAALSSMPYTPQESLQAIKGFYKIGDKLLGPAGFYDAFSEELDFWPQRYLAIDQGPIIVMIENYRSGLLWDLFMSAPEVEVGMRKLGFGSN